MRKDIQAMESGQDFPGAVPHPPHPGETLKDEVILPLGLSVAEAAERFGMSHADLSHVLDAKAGISPDLALRLEHAGISTARAWLALQASYDLWCAKGGNASGPVLDDLLARMDPETFHDPVDFGPPVGKEAE